MRLFKKIPVVPDSAARMGVHFHTTNSPTGCNQATLYVLTITHSFPIFEARSIEALIGMGKQGHIYWAWRGSNPPPYGYESV